MYHQDHSYGPHSYGILKSVLIITHKKIKIQCIYLNNIKFFLNPGQSGHHAGFLYRKDLIKRLQSAKKRDIHFQMKAKNM